ISVANGTLGCVDAYTGAGGFFVSNSSSIGAIGRGFTTKPDSREVVFQNLVVTDLDTNPANPAPLGACVGMNSGVVPSVGSNMIIDDVICRNTAGAGIIYNASNINGR